MMEFWLLFVAAAAVIGADPGTIIAAVTPVPETPTNRL